MARVPAEQKTADEIIGQLEGLDAINLGRVIESATSIRQQKQAAEREAFVARVREEAAAIGLRPEELFAPTPAAPRKTVGATRKRGAGVVATKFRHGEHSWSGRGKTPGWLSELKSSGRKREEFLAKDGQHDLIEQAKREHGEAPQ